eukprot:scaffold27063_cov64-Phaeocystis_antarctica.AAC.3
MIFWVVATMSDEYLVRVRVRARVRVRVRVGLVLALGLVLELVSGLVSGLGLGSPLLDVLLARIDEDEERAAISRGHPLQVGELVVADVGLLGVLVRVGFGLGLGLRLGLRLGFGFRSFGRCLLGHDDAVLGGDRDEVRAALIEDETGGGEVDQLLLVLFTTTLMHLVDHA